MIALTPFPQGGYLVKSEADVHLVVRRMLGLFRLAEVPEAEPRDTWRYWCYRSFEAAVLAASAWSPSIDDEPVGWIKRGGARQA